MTDESSHWDFLDDGALHIPRPIPSKKHPEGKLYTIQSPNAEVGMRLKALAEIQLKQAKGINVSDDDVARLKMSDGEARDWAEQVMGDTYREMVADDVPWVIIERLLSYAYLHFGISPQAAQRAAESGYLTGKAARPNRAQRRAETTQQGRPASTASRNRPRRRR